MPPKRAHKKPKQALSVLLVDDHPMWRETVRMVLEKDGAGAVVGQAADGDAAVEEAARVRPDVVVMDMGLPALDGPAATRAILRAHPDAKVLVLSASDLRSDVLAAVEAGASGYLLKTAEPDQVVDAVQRVAKGELVFAPELASHVLAELRGSNEISVAVIDDDALYREGLIRVLMDAGFTVTVAARDVQGLLDKTDREPVHVIVLDVADTGGQPLRALRDAHPEAALLVLAEQVDAETALGLLNGDARGVGYLLKGRVADVEELADAIRRVASGSSAIDPTIVSRFMGRGTGRDPVADLTEREREVLSLMAEGRSNQAICELLFLTAKTVESHVRAIFTKLGLEPAADEHRRVMAVLAYLRSSRPREA